MIEPRRPPRRARAALCLLSALLVTSVSSARETGRLLVVVGTDSAVTRISEREVRKLFLGKVGRLPDGSNAVLVRHEPTRTLFNTRALGRSDAQVTAAWSRLKFSGRVRTPHEFESAEALVRFIASTPNAIGYLEAAELPEGVRGVFVVP